IQQLKRLHPDVIIFIDEPYLSSFGSAFINLTREQVLLYLGEVIDAVHQEGALAGIHCCGNTDWSLVMDTETDIVNFDAYEYFQGMTLYIDNLNNYLNRGGVLAWGIIPTSDKIKDETDKSLRDKFFDRVDDLENRGVPRDLLLNQSLITPSCGMGTMKYSLAEEVLHKLAETSKIVRKKLPARNCKKAG
ncbi:methionine synthase, partial [bacterium]|nr:methionine synthase [bacterium]MBU1652075.1 methionine synthase [bacterium]